MTQRRPIPLLAVLLLLASWLPMTAMADTTCTATSTPLAFGATSGGSDAVTSGSVTVNCSSLGLNVLAVAKIRMCLHIGAGSAGSGTLPRRMQNAQGDRLDFQIYRDAARTQIWGSSNTPATPTPVQRDLQYSIPFIGASGSTGPISMYGRLPAQPGLAAGDYTSAFTGADARVDYRYAEGSAVLFPPGFPSSCTSGGNGGGSINFGFTAGATVPGHCTIAAADNLDFGTVPGLIDINHDQTSSITMTCTGRTAWSMALDNGQNATGNVRRMRLDAGGTYVDYELYRNAARSQRWGSNAGETLLGTGTGTTQTLTVHGRVPAGQAIPAGAYRDVVTVTVTY